MRLVSNIISYVLHPVFVPFMVSMLLMYLCPQLWQGASVKQLGLWRIQLIVNTIFFPLLVVALMRGIGFIKNFKMQDTRERLGPMMAIMLFYFWNFWVFHKLTNSPELFRAFLLGTFLTTSILFLVTIFVKVSLHVAGMAGAVCILFCAALLGSCVSIVVPVIATILLLIVAYARYQLREHTKAELVLGAGIGVLCTLAAYLLYI